MFIALFIAFHSFFRKSSKFYKYNSNLNKNYMLGNKHLHRTGKYSQLGINPGMTVKWSIRVLKSYGVNYFTIYKWQWQQITVRINLTSSVTYLLWEEDSHTAIPPNISVIRYSFSWSTALKTETKTFFFFYLYIVYTYYSWARTKCAINEWNRFSQWSPWWSTDWPKVNHFAGSMAGNETTSHTTFHPMHPVADQ